MENSDKLVMRIGMVILAVLLVACLKSCDELRYRWTGKTTRATVSSITEEHDRYLNLIGYKVWYGFFNTNSGKEVSGCTPISVDEHDNYSVGQTVQIEYIGGELFTTRIVGTGSRFWPILLLVFVVGSIAGVVVLTLRANRGWR